MEKSVQITLIVVVGVLLLAGMGYYLISSSTSSNTISVNGQATIKAVPDLVVAYFNIETKAPTAEAARNESFAIYDKFIAELIVQGFDAEEAKTQSFNVYPDYSWSGGRQNILGYRATHSIRVEMSTNDTSKISKLIDAGINSGVSMSYINFELSSAKQSEYKAEAMKSAAEDARIKAEATAEGFNKKVGRLVSTSVNDFNYYPWMAYDYANSGASMETAKAAVSAIQPGEQDITASVTAKYKLR